MKGYLAVSKVKSFEKRNDKVLILWKTGFSYEEIARVFHISRERVRQILKELEPEEKRRRRARRILQYIKSSNTVEEAWPIELLIELLQLPETVSWRLSSYFRAENILELSLMSFMDLLFVDQAGIPKDYRDAFPICKGHGIGFKTHAFLVNHITQLDMGETFHREWSIRREKLMAYLKALNERAPLFLRRYSYPYEYGVEKKATAQVSWVGHNRRT